MTQECHKIAKHIDAAGNVRDSAYFLREGGWHKLGQVVERPAVDEQILQLSGLDFEITLEEITCGAAARGVPTHRAVMRSDSKAILGVVSPTYRPVQNKELMDWVRSMEAVGDVTVETAGALYQGQLVWVLARVAGLAFDVNGDEHKGYMSFMNGHDGSMKLICTPTTVRVQCNNTFQAVMRAGRGNTLSTGFELRHTSQVIGRMEKIKQLYAQAAEDFRNTKEVLAFLASKPLTDAKLDRMFREPWLTEKPKVTETVITEAGVTEETIVEEGDRRAREIADERVDRLQSILASPTCQHPGTKDTLFAAWNAVTEYLEYDTPARGAKGLFGAEKTRSQDENRLYSNIKGVAFDRKAKALTLALELAEIA